MIVSNPDKEHVQQVLKAIQNNDGYCPCAVLKTPDTKCMCKDFKDKIDDPCFTGYCNCQLYKKEEV